MSAVVFPDILASLGSVRERVERHLMTDVERYGALLTIERAISELSSFQDLSASLSDIRDNVRAQLNETREYRALCAVDKILPELSEVVAFLVEKSAAPQAIETPAHDAAGLDVPVDTSSVEEFVSATTEVRGDATDAGEPSADRLVSAEASEATAIGSPEAASAEVAMAGAQQGDAPPTVAREDDAPETRAALDEGPAASDSMIASGYSDVVEAPVIAEGTFDTPEHGNAEPETEVATLAYNLAHMLVQSLPASQGEAKSSQLAHGDAIAEGAAVIAPAESAAHAGRAA